MPSRDTMNGNGEIGNTSAEPAGYSNATQRRKLGVRPGSVVLTWHAPAHWMFADPMDDVDIVTSSNRDHPVDIVLAFAREPADVASIGNDLAGEIFPNGNLWVAWPRKAAGHRSEVTEQLLRDLLLPLGIVDTKVAAIDHNWSGLRFAWRKELRTHASAAHASSAYAQAVRC